MQKAQAALTEAKTKVEAKIEKFRAEEEKRNRFWNNILKRQEITASHVKETHTAIAEFLDILADALKQVDPHDENDATNNYDILKWMIEYLAKVLKASKVSLPKVIEGTRIPNGKQVFAIYQGEFEDYLRKSDRSLKM